MSRRRILEVFNRYAFYGGEEKIADQIIGWLAEDHDVQSCRFDSREWQEPGAPGKLGQVTRLFYNQDSRQKFEDAVQSFRPDVALFHNVFPVGSPSLYHAAHRQGIPIVQYVHNFRPFSVGGSLFVNRRLTPQALHGNIWPEVWQGAWQGSVLKSLLMALALRRLLKSGWLDQVKVWLCISEFMRDQFVEAGIAKERTFVLKHPSVSEVSHEHASEDQPSYLFLGRLVEEKGIHVLLQAWQLVCHQLQDQAPELWIAGEGPLQLQVKQAAEINSKIRYLGMLRGEDKLRALSSCRAVIVPSIWWEPLGLVVYEAYQFSKPVLAAASGGLKETVMQASTGFQHSPGDADTLAADVIRMERMSTLQRQSMGQAGNAWLQENAALQPWKKNMQQILEKAAASSTAHR